MLIIKQKVNISLEADQSAVFPFRKTHSGSLLTGDRPW